MKDLALARDSGRHLIEKFPNAAAGVRRDAWLVGAHATFGLAGYADAEQAYGHVLEATPEADASRTELVENLAASIYKQGEQANQAGDYRTAANHFVRVKQVAPTSKICAAAGTAGAALHCDWTAAAPGSGRVPARPSMSCRRGRPSRSPARTSGAGQLARSASSTGRSRKSNPQLRAEHCCGRAACMRRPLARRSRPGGVLEVSRGVPQPVRQRWERSDCRISKARDQARHHHQLKGKSCVPTVPRSERTDHTRSVRARDAGYQADLRAVASAQLVQPFERSLRRSNGVWTPTEAFGGLVDYWVRRSPRRPPSIWPRSREFPESLCESGARPIWQDALKAHEQQLAAAAARGEGDRGTRRTSS